jgi:hypothetical protein
MNSFAVPTIEAVSDRPAKRQRTTSSLDVPAPAVGPDVDNSPQTAHEARIHISKELSTNGLLSGHQRSVLETAISFVDQLSHTPTPTMTDRSTFDESMHVSTDITKREIFNIILGSKSIYLEMFRHITDQTASRVERTRQCCHSLPHCRSCTTKGPRKDRARFDGRQCRREDP